MKLSARNQLAGTVASVTEGAVEAKVVVDIGGGRQMVSVITVDAVRDLGLQVGDSVVAIVKADAVLIGKA